MYVGFGTNIATPGQGNIIRSCFAEESTIFFGTLLNPRLVIALLSFGLAGVLAG